jgi:polyhydroxyalkanoate synthesis regulator phasin
MNRDSDDYRELDLLCGNQMLEIKELSDKLKLAEAEVNALRDRVRILEQQVYNGSTM